MNHDMDVSIKINELPVPKQYELLKLNEIQEFHKDYNKNKEIVKLNNYGNLFGSHLPMRLMIENEQARRVGRLFNEKSSNILLDNLNNKLDKIEFNDYMGYDNPNKNKIDYEKLFY